MGYGADLKQLLKPLGVYRFDGYSGGELDALGYGLDRVEESLKSLQSQLFLQTMGQQGAEYIKELFPIVGTREIETNTMMTLFQIDQVSFTPEEIQKTLEACGVPVTLTEQGKMQILVTLTQALTNAEDAAAQMWVLEQILPCHLGITCIYQYTNSSTGSLVQEQASLDALRSRSRKDWENILSAEN